MCDAARSTQLRAEDRVVVRYVENPNGSLDDIAGICNEGRNVVGLMPHPERASDALLGSADGVVMLRRCSRPAASRGLSEYAFGDTDLARERLGIVADTFAAPTTRCSPTCRPPPATWSTWAAARAHDRAAARRPAAE